MKKRFAVVTVVIAALIAAVATWSLTRTYETDVYSVVLAPFPEAAPILTSKPSDCKAEVPIKGIPDDLLRSFLEANRTGAPPISLTRLKWDYSTADPSKLKRVDEAGLSHQFFIPKGKAIVYLSRVGYSGDKSSALFCLENQRGLLIYLRETDGVWRVASTETTWAY
jgi:hypothetical protein